MFPKGTKKLCFGDASVYGSLVWWCWRPTVIVLCQCNT